jgi:hypothetical protein
MLNQVANPNIMHINSIFGLTRIRLQLANLFLPPSRQFAGKHCKIASFSFEHEAPAKIAPARAPSVGIIRETTVSFGFPAVCNDRFNYRLDGPINLHCRISGLFESIDRLFDITALLLPFRLFTFRFSSNFAVLARRGFPSCFFPLFCFFPGGAKQCENC